MNEEEMRKRREAYGVRMSDQGKELKDDLDYQLQRVLFVVGGFWVIFHAFAFIMLMYPGIGGFVIFAGIVDLLIALGVIFWRTSKIYIRKEK